jgi:hypothetical protein
LSLNETMIKKELFYKPFLEVSEYKNPKAKIIAKI